MLRDLLNDVPEWVLALCFVGVVVLLTSGFLTALILQYPYSGSIAVKSDPLVEGPRPISAGRTEGWG